MSVWEFIYSTAYMAHYGPCAVTASNNVFSFWMVETFVCFKCLKLSDVNGRQALKQTYRMRHARCK